MKTQPKVADLVEILLTEITELKETIQTTSNYQKKIEAQLEEFSKASIHVDTNQIDKKLSDFTIILEQKIQECSPKENQEKKVTFLQKSDFKLLVLTLLSSFLFGISVTLIVNQSNRIKDLKHQISLLLDDVASNKASSL